jgi:hypothetical protein
LVDAVAKIFLLFRPTQRIMTCNDPQLQLAWYLVDAVAMLLWKYAIVWRESNLRIYWENIGNLLTTCICKTNASSAAFAG